MLQLIYLPIALRQGQPVFYSLSQESLINGNIQRSIYVCKQTAGVFNDHGLDPRSTCILPFSDSPAGRLMRKLVKREFNERVTIVSVAAPLALSMKILFASSQIPEMSKHGHDNPSFVGDFVYTIPGEFRQNFTQFYPGKHRETFEKRPPPSQFQVPREEEKPASIEKTPKAVKDRDSWGKGIEFLLSCIAMSVGLGNIWRFPFIALGESRRGVK